MVYVFNKYFDLWLLRSLRYDTTCWRYSTFNTSLAYDCETIEFITAQQNFFASSQSTQQNGSNTSKCASQNTASNQSAQKTQSLPTILKLICLLPISNVSPKPTSTQSASHSEPTHLGTPAYIKQVYIIQQPVSGPSNSIEDIKK